MTFGYKTMLQIEGEITYRFSIGGVTARHSTGSTGRIRDLFNLSWQKLREIVSLASDGSYLVPTTPANLPTTAAVTGETYAEIDWPVDAVGIYGVRVVVNNGRWYPLKKVPFQAYQDYQYEALFSGYAPNRGPIGYTPRLIPTNTANVETVGKIMIFPVPTSGQYVLWKLQGWAPQTTDTATFPGMAAFHEWAVLDTLLAMAQPDAARAKQYEIWAAERSRAEKRITDRAMQFDAMPLEPRDGRFDGYDQEVWNGPY